MGENAAVGLVGEGLAVVADGSAADMTALARTAAKQALVQLGSAPNLAFVFAAASDPDDAEQALLAANSHLSSGTVLGASASGVMAAGRGSDEGAAVAVWAARIPGLRARSFHLEVLAGDAGHQIVGLPGRRRDDVAALILADPWSFPTSDFAAHAKTLMTDLPVVGAVASGPAPARTTRLLIDGRIHQRGAVGVMVGGHAQVVTLQSPACRPVGPVLTVTEAEGFLLKTLAGEPAALRAQEIIAALDEPERSLALSGLQLGFAVTEDPHVGDFVIHDFHPADGERGALQVSGHVPLGAAVQFQVRDEDAADEDLNVMLEGVAARMGSRSVGALIFSSADRGRFMFGNASHDAAAVAARLGVPAVGTFAQGEVAPTGEGVYLNRQTATVVVFGAGPRAVVGHSQAVRPQRIAEADPVAREVHRMLADLAQPPDEGLL
ncbi:MAG: FIST C-terminal domain-containing protein [Candidatus Nanopelagicales bacterium]|nr:FIST C-terminal domain-containing protein [Candidatus Nanopelagicales bacterium]